MSGPYRLFGAALSPFSIKVRSYLRWKGIEHEWITRGRASEAELTAKARLPLLPTLADATGATLQDSSFILDALERRHDTPALALGDPKLDLLARLIEEYADEWANKVLFHFRWSDEADQLFAAKRIVDEALAGEDVEDRRPLEAAVRERMNARLGSVGSCAETAPLFEASLRRLTSLLDAHLAHRPYLFGGRPSRADFALGAQMQQMLHDPTSGGLIRAHGVHVAEWADRVDEPASQGEIEPFEALAPTLEPLLRDEIAAIYLPWAVANSEASRIGKDTFETVLDGTAFSQPPQRFAAKSFYEARQARQDLAEDEDLTALLARIGAAEALAMPQRAAGERAEQAGDEDAEEMADAADEAAEDPAEA